MQSLDSAPIPLLDHGFIRLVASMGDDLAVVRSARVSYDAAARAGKDEGSDHRLIQYLWKNGHSTPFESVEFQFEIKAPIFVFRQWHRHRTWSYNELSARYRELPEEFYVPDPVMIGAQSKDTKQARELYNTFLSQSHHDKSHDSAAMIRAACEASFAAYRTLLERGVPRELARTVLPLATYSHMFGKVDLKNLFGFLSERAHPHAQYEIRVYAEAMLELIRPIVPACVEAWEANR